MTEVILTEKVCVTQLWTVCIQYPPNTTPHYPHSCIIVILMEYQDTASQCQASVEFLGNQFPVVGIVSVSITVVCRVWRPASLGTGPYPVPQPPRRQREEYLYIVLYISILECVISLYLYIYESEEYLYISMTASHQAPGSL